MKELLFEGLATALVTPMKNGGSDIDYEAFERLCAFQAEGGAAAVVVCGTTGEAPTVTDKEKEELFSLAVKTLSGRLKVIAGCGSPSTEKAAELASVAKKCGCDGVLTVTPYYNKCSAAGLYMHYKSVAEAAELPVIVYNVPSRTGLDISMEAYEKLALIEGVVGIKEASGRVVKTEKIVSRFGNRFAVYSGSDELTLPLYSVGARGVISVVSNVFPSAMARLCSLCSAGDMVGAREIQLSLYPIIMAMFSDVNPIPVKEAMAELGLCLSDMRLPLCSMDEKMKRELMEKVACYKGEL